MRFCIFIFQKHGAVQHAGATLHRTEVAIDRRLSRSMTRFVLRGFRSIEHGVRAANLLHASTPPEIGERFEPIGQLGSVELERIVSSAQPELGEYAQAHDEWVLLVRGTARLEIGDDELDLVSGDYVLLPAHTRHRVLETSDGALWLALHDRTARGLHRVHLATEDGDLLTAYLPLDAEGRLIRAPGPHLVKATFGEEHFLGEFERGDARWNRIAWAGGESSFTDLAIAPLRRYATVRLYDDGTDPMDAYEYLVREVRRA